MKINISEEKPYNNIYDVIWWCHDRENNCCFCNALLKSKLLIKDKRMIMNSHVISNNSDCEMFVFPRSSSMFLYMPDGIAIKISMDYELFKLVFDSSNIENLITHPNLIEYFKGLQVLE